MSNCNTSEDASNVVSSNKKNIFSALQSILGVYTVYIPISILRRFATRVVLNGYGKKSKVDLCLVLVDFKAICCIIPTETEASEKVTINRRRYLNVLFSDIIRPLLATRGQPLNKDHLKEGVKKDEELHATIALEYNKEDVKHYSRNTFPEIRSSRINNASVFGEIS